MLLKYVEHVKKLQTDILYHEEGQNTVTIDFFLATVGIKRISRSTSSFLQNF